MVNQLTVQSLSTIKLAAKKLSGSKRRAFQAQVTKDYLGGSGRRAERVFGWSRTTVEKGLRELETGIVCIDNFSARGRYRTEEKDPALEAAIRALVDPKARPTPPAPVCVSVYGRHGGKGSATVDRRNGLP
jgi:hypothetical protein